MQLSDFQARGAAVRSLCEAFATVLNGVFHERIEYPSISPAAAAHVAAQQNARLPQQTQAQPAPQDEQQPAAEPTQAEPANAAAPAAQDEMPSAPTEGSEDA